MTKTSRVWSLAVALAALLSSGAVMAQSPVPVRGEQTQPPPRGGRAGGRAALPPITPNMNQQQLQAYIDAYALVQAERELQLTAEQYPSFVAKLRQVQDIRRRHQGERRRILGELNGLLQGEAGKDDAILARLKALDDLAQQSATELRKAYQDLDVVLTPWQRGRYRMFEEQLERRKVELLAKINAK